LHQLGLTRSVRRANHSLHTPDAFIRTQIPGMTKGAAIVHASPALGAAFTQYTAEMETGGTLGDCPWQRFLFVLEGSVEVSVGPSHNLLAKNDYAYLPEGTNDFVVASEPSRLAVIEKRYKRWQSLLPAEPFSSSESKIAGQPLMGDPDLIVRSLLPDTMAFDFAVNTMTYQPGASLSMVEVHVMEHGLLMLEGGGIYRLDEEWYPVTAGDFVWMGPYCPQWFGAIGRAPAKYLIYKDWNRHPLS
jgi:(S)-ureidoglycine aminohydrolase